MKVAIFTGPTLAADAGRAVLEATYFPPAAQGDVYRAARQRPRAIGIVDGYFECVPSVWHKEILWALAQGIRVYGSASMGALRAVECAQFGMIGVGAVFEAFRDGVLEDDDEVAVVHGPADSGYRPLSEAMVNVRWTLAAAEAAGVLDAASCQVVERVAKALYYPERAWPRILAASVEAGVAAARVEAMRGWLPTRRVDRKRADALAMLMAIRDVLAADRARAPAAFTIARSAHWERARRAMKSASHTIHAGEGGR
jgi:hypothetical protein